MPKTLDTTLYKARLCYEHGQLRLENINRNRDRSRTFPNSQKPSFKPNLYRKHNNSFPSKRYFNKIGARPNVPSPNTNIPIVNAGSKDASLQLSHWKYQGPYYVRYCPNETSGVLHNLHEYPTLEDMSSTPRIYATLDGQQCNILNFGPNTYRHVPIDYADCLDVLFLYWVDDPIAYEHDDLFYILGVRKLLLIYIYMLVCVGRGP